MIFTLPLEKRQSYVTKVLPWVGADQFKLGHIRVQVGNLCFWVVFGPNTLQQGMIQYDMTRSHAIFTKYEYKLPKKRYETTYMIAIFGSY